MFKGKYSQDMESVTPSEEALSKTKERMYAEAALNKPRLFGTKQLIALATCFCLIIGSFAVILMNSSPFSDKDFYKGLENPYVFVPDSKVVINGSAMTLKTGTSYSDIYGRLKTASVGNNYFYGRDSLFTSEMVNSGLAMDDSASANKALSGNVPDFSDTNNQVKGVQEADIIKTDGRYIYACGKTNAYYGYYRYYDENTSNSDKKEDTAGRVYILSADNGKIDLVSTVKIRDTQDNTQYVLTEILLYGDTLVLIKSGYRYEEPKLDDISAEYYKSSYYSGYFGYTLCFTSVEIYDISDRTKPVFKNELYQSGYYNSSRMIGSELYIITTQYVYSPDEDKPETYIPHCSSYKAAYLVPLDCIYIADEMKSAIYTVITGIDVTKPDNHKSNVSVLGFAGTVYSSGSNIYIAAYRPNNLYNYIEVEEDSVSDVVNNDIKSDSSSKTDTSKDYSNEVLDTKLGGITDIYRFSIDNAVITYSANGSVDGNLINQFAMDEFDGAFRVATTVYEYESRSNNYYNSDGKRYYYYNQSTHYNNLYILNADLNITGSITGIAPDERIYSVRFDGTVGYMVTFRQTDPLFAIDLSDKSAPRVLSALKIPGFSTYMQTYGDGLLFGFGRDADEDGRALGLKLSMFDVSDKTDVTEQAILKLGTEYYDSAALNNHKAILVDANKNIIGFPVVHYNTNNYYSKNAYAFYKYENERFVKLGIINMSDNYNYNGLRGLYIGNFVYIFCENEAITSYDLSTFKQVDTLAFN
ncbi:MAG: hypothetical protein CVU97_04775 [Firmicutes bacterium HGW-Firmicutes-21]|nr:MAG: hypothetical protein CVU97_04775 [Firmicutes bacterium HGW-Firmicutes-21]